MTLVLNDYYRSSASYRVSLGLGAQYALNFVPAPLEALYGGDPDGAMLFVRLRVG